jgi:hypothetical protein
MRSYFAKVFSAALLLLSPVLVLAQSAADRGELTVAPAKAPYKPMTFRDRMDWTVRSTVGTESLLAGTLSAGFGTALDRPKEYGPHWDGFAERYGMRLTGVATSNVMESTLGAALGEDPRYFRLGGESTFGTRMKNVVRTTFVARNRDGGYRPAYARLLAVPASNFLSNTWRADSEANVHDALLRTLLGFAGHMTRNAYDEFRPSKK